MEKSKGLGDSIEKFTKFIGVKSFVQMVNNKRGVKDCVCNKRRKWLNKQFPYKNK